MGFLYGVYNTRGMLSWGTCGLCVLVLTGAENEMDAEFLDMECVIGFQSWFIQGIVHAGPCKCLSYNEWTCFSKICFLKKYIFKPFESNFTCLLPCLEEQ